MKLLRLIIAFASVLCLPGCVRAEGPANPFARLIPIFQPGASREEEALPPVDATKQTLRDMRLGYANSSFEQRQTDFVPADWGLLLQPSYPVTDTPYGSRAALVSLSHHYYQDLALSLPAWQTVSFGAAVRGELGVEAPRVTLEAFGPGVLLSQPTGSDEPAGIEWSHFFGSFTRQQPRGETTFRTRIQSRSEVDWINMDDVFLVFEEIANGGFENTAATGNERNGWAFENGARLTDAETPLRGERSLWLPAGSAANQLVAHTPFAVTYFIAGEASGQFRLDVTRLKSSGAVSDSSTSHLIKVPLSGEFFVEMPRADDAHAERVTLRSEGDGPVMVDRLSRGWSYVWPPVFSPVENSPSPTMRIAAAWPANLSQFGVTIHDESGIEVARLDDEMLRDQTTIWTDFDGADLTAGDYTVRFELSGLDGARVMLVRPFTLQRPAAFAEEPAPLQFDEFVRMPWLWFIPYTPEMAVQTVDEAEEKLRLAKEDGNNFFMLVLDRSQFAMFKEAAERVGVPYVIFDFDLASLMRRSIAHETYDPYVFLQELPELSVFQDSPLFRGIYIADEPNGVGPEVLARVVDMAVILERDPAWPPAYSFMNPNRSIVGADMPIVSTFNYPSLRLPQSNEEMFTRYVAETEEEISYALAEDRPFWGGTQGYGSLFQDPPPSPAQASTQLGLLTAMGASGYFSFVYTSLNPFSGLRGHDYSPSPRHEPYREFNTRIEKLWPTLRELSREREAPLLSENVIVRLAEHPDGDYFAFVVNYDDELTVDVDISTSATTTMTDVDSGAVVGAGMQFATTLGPGEWKVFRFDGSVKPRSFVGAYRSVPAEAGPVAQVLYRVAIPERGEISLNPARGSFAGNFGNNIRAFDFEGTQLYERFQANSPGGVKYLAPDLFFAGGRRWGATLFEHTAEGVAIRWERARHTGGAFDVIPVEDDKLWIALSFRGVGFVDISNGGYEVLDWLPSEDYDYYSLHGPFADGSIGAVEHVYGFYRYWRDGEGLQRERYSELGAYAAGSTSPSGTRVATGALDRGVAVYDILSSGTVVRETRIVDPDLIIAAETAWLSEDTLAVVDMKRNVRFYHVGRGGDWFHLGNWDPAEGPVLIESISALPEEKLLAVSLYRKEVVIADVSAFVEERRAPTGWLLH